MELDELKNRWTVLEKQLKKNEILNKQLVLGMLHKKSDKSLNRLINTDVISIIIYFLLIPVGIWYYNVKFPSMGALLSLKIFAIAVISVAVMGIIWISYKLRYLKKIDFLKSIKDNMYCITKYAMMIKQEKLASYYLVAPVIFISGAFVYYELKVTLSFWSILIVALIAGLIISVWMYKKIYDSNIQSIKLNLEELRELEEEEEKHIQKNG
ncbi:MAG: hypothetical protein FWC10_04900 [Lentimicrobiaceae bacterium]|nr:hypothetical protein [Lentimicrobiaceae bacterium]